MPKIPAFTLAWSSAKQAYELHETRDRGILGIVPDSPEWFRWLEQVTCFAFNGKSGHYTARKEARQRGGRYWSAYLTVGEQLTKKYLGKGTDLSLARLEQVAGILGAHSETLLQPPETLVSLPINQEADAASPAVPAQQHLPLYPLLATKLHMPRPRTRLVSRAHLVDRLKQGMSRHLTLVSAPAGFGKTTLLAQWRAESGFPVAWLSLEAEDNDPTRFLSYLVASLQTLDAQLGTTALALLRTPRPPPAETVLAVIISEVISRNAGEFALVLDDYHVITTESIHRGMTFLLEHLPPPMHLVLATRADPPLPLARLRAQGRLREVRASDLRFEASVANAFLHEVMGLDLEDSDVAALERRTEGWIAGLQLAALSLQGGTDISALLETFSGSHRYVLDYLSEEVLARQPKRVQRFLLHTCLLERLSGPLCDALTEQEGSQAMLEVLERANLFVIPLDDERVWYRYHHLFAQVLRSHLQEAEPALLPVLHRRASAWYEQHALPIEAVQHALAVPDADLAARLIEPIALSVAFQGRISTVLGWINALPDALVGSRPFLCVYHASMLIFANQLEAAEIRLHQAEHAIRKGLPAAQAQAIPGWVLAVRGDIASFSGDLLRGAFLARQALTLLPEAEVIPRAGAMVTVARAYLVSGDVTLATEREVTAAVALNRTFNNPFAAVTSMNLLARLHVLQGRLRQAAAIYEQVAQLVPRPEVLQSLFGSLSHYFGRGDLLREWNELDLAEQHLSLGMALVKETVTLGPFVAVLGYTSLARLQQARGSTAEALATLDALERLAEQRRFAPSLMSQVSAVRTQIELAQGNLAAAVRWAESSGLSSEDDDVPYLQEAAYLTLVRTRLVQARDDPASSSLPAVLRLLDRLLCEAEARERLASALHILVLRALALQAGGDRIEALATLERALVLAAPEGYIRLFVDEGAPMLALLRLAKAHSSVPGYVAALLSAFGELNAASLPHLSPHRGPLVEPLTEREQEVLHLLLEGASNREIARRLLLSVNTVKRHVFNLCGKLGVRSRAQAIALVRDEALR